MDYESGGSIFCLNCYSFFMINSKIENSQAKEGGAISLVQNENLKF